MYSRGAQIGAEWNEKSGDTLADEMERIGDKWYGKSGKVIAKPLSLEWANTLQACQGIISFDAVLCRGPRHSLPITTKDDQKSEPWYWCQDAHMAYRIATYAVKGCCKCGTSPEGFSEFGISPSEQFPLLAPPPLHNSTAKSAKAPPRDGINNGKLLVRCLDCLRNRYCESCHKWWCEDCYETSNSTSNVPTVLQHLDSVGREDNVKVHMGLCVECLVPEMMVGAGSFGMWG